jgi:hypothetical protein
VLDGCAIVSVAQTSANANFATSPQQEVPPSHFKASALHSFHFRIIVDIMRPRKRDFIAAPWANQ